MRHAFTLIEILVVITIIIIITGIVWAVYADSLTAARITATRTTLTLIDSGIGDHRQQFEWNNWRSHGQQFKAAYDPYDHDNDPSTARIVTNNPSTIPLQLAILLVRKNAFKAAFPQRVEDTWGFDGLPDTVDDSPMWRHWKETVNATASDPRPAPHVIETESSELLLMSLRHFGFIYDLDGKHIGDFDGDGTAEIVDDWGNPVRFYNWPTRLVRPDGPGQPIAASVYLQSGFLLLRVPLKTDIISWDYRHTLNMDPDDRTGLIALRRDGEDFDQNGSLSTYDFNGNGTIDSDETEDTDQNGSLNVGSHPNLSSPFTLVWRTRGGFVPTTAQPITEDWYHTLNTWHQPLLVSAGPDGRLGLGEPTAAGPERLAQPLDADAIQDNVSVR